MEKMQKVFEIQRNARDNVKSLQTYMTDLQNWESEMKRKEAALNGEFEQDLPPVRSKIKKEKPVHVKAKPEQRIHSSNYTAWDKFDVDKACEDVDMEDVGPVSLDSKKSQQIKQEKLREEAQYEKERGNNFVKLEKWDEAIACYNRAIELVKDDAIYYANRALCYLKKDSLHQAETDCTEALRLDPTYVKALQRRACARERLGSLRAASSDLGEVLRLEPRNAAARTQLNTIRARMGTKGSKSKSSPSSTPTMESKPITTSSKSITPPKIVELPNEPAQVEKEPTETEKWRDGVGETVTIIRPVKKPPHLRSKRALKSVQIQEIQLGKTLPEKPPTRLKIIEIEDDLAHGDTNNNKDSNKIDESVVQTIETKGEGDKKTNTESEKFINDSIIMEKNSRVTEKDSIVTEKDSIVTVKDSMVVEKDSKVIKNNSIVTKKDSKVMEEGFCVQNLVPPVNSVQFMYNWKCLKEKGDARSCYLSIINPKKIPSIFENALESDVLSEVLRELAENKDKFREKTVAAYLKGLCRVKRFSALAMFLSNSDKELLTKLLHHCKVVEHCSEDKIAYLKNKFEL